MSSDLERRQVELERKFETLTARVKEVEERLLAQGERLKIAERAVVILQRDKGGDA